MKETYKIITKRQLEKMASKIDETGSSFSYLDGDDSTNSASEDEVSATGSIDGTNVGTKPAYTDTHSNFVARNNYWWSRSQGGARGLSYQMTKEELRKEALEERGKKKNLTEGKITKQHIDGLTNYQYQIIIGEARGVGGYSDREVIDEIYNIVQNYYKNNEHQDKFKLKITELEKSKWIGELVLNIKIVNKPNNTGGEWIVNTDKEDNKIVDGKIKRVEIFINAHSDNGVIDKRLFFKSMYHEINHAYENFDGLQNSRNNPLEDRSKKQGYKSFRVGLNHYQTEPMKSFVFLCYKLLIPTEFNANVASVYGELRAMDADRYSDFHETSSAKLWHEMRSKWIPTITNADMEYWLDNFYNEFRIIYPKVNKYKPGEEFKKYFLKLADERMSKFSEKLIRSAHVWFDEKGHMKGNRKFNIYEFNLNYDNHFDIDYNLFEDRTIEEKKYCDNKINYDITNISLGSNPPITPKPEIDEVKTESHTKGKLENKGLNEYKIKPNRYTKKEFEEEFLQERLGRKDITNLDDYKKHIDGLTNYQYQIIINEKKGVAGYEDRCAIEEIYEKVQHKYSNTQEQKFTLIVDELNKSPWVDKLILNITIVDDKENTGGKWIPNKENKHNEIVNEKIQRVELSINCYSDNGIIDKGLFYKSIYHEINYAYENFDGLKHNNKTPLTDRQPNINKFMLLMGLSDGAVKDFMYICYRFLIPTELHALIASVYGELRGMNSEDREDVFNTYAFRTYEKVKNELLPNVMNANNDLWASCFYKNYLVIHPEANKYEPGEEFKKNFEKYLENSFHKFRKNLIRSAEMWFDEKGHILNERKFNIHEFHLNYNDSGFGEPNSFEGKVKKTMYCENKILSHIPPPTKPKPTPIDEILYKDYKTKLPKILFNKLNEQMKYSGLTYQTDKSSILLCKVISNRRELNYKQLKELNEIFNKCNTIKLNNINELKEWVKQEIDNLKVESYTKRELEQILTEENQALKSHIFQIPNNLYNQLYSLFKQVKDNKQYTNLDGYKRLNNIINARGKIGYDWIRRIKNYFDSYGGDGSDWSYKLNGGDDMKEWANQALDSAENKIKSGKEAMRNAGVNNAFIKTHYKDNPNIKVNPKLVKAMESLEKMNRKYENIHSSRANYVILMEKTGISMYEFEDEIEMILDMIECEINKTGVQYNNSYTYRKGVINTNKINWINNLEISFTIIDTPSKRFARNMKNGGMYDSANNNTVKNGKFDKARIDLRGVSINGWLIRESLKPYLYHELNHAYQNYQMLLKNSNYSLYNQNDDKYYKEIDYLSNDDDENIRIFMETMYFLFTPSERNAKVEQLYGELKDTNNNITRFDDLYKTNVYQEFELIKKEYIPRILNTGDLYWNEFKDFLKYNGTPEQNRAKFKRESDNYLKTMKQKMGKVMITYLESKNDFMAEHDTNTQRELSDYYKK